MAKPLKDQSERRTELVNLLRPYGGKWVALPKKGKVVVIASANSFGSLMTKLGGHKYNDLEFIQAESEN